MGSGIATAYLGLVKGKKAYGHLPVVQALLWQNDGIIWEEAELVSAYQSLMGLVSAALRLNLVEPLLLKLSSANCLLSWRR